VGKKIKETLKNSKTSMGFEQEKEAKILIVFLRMRYKISVVFVSYHIENKRQTKNKQNND